MCVCLRRSFFRDCFELIDGERDVTSLMKPKDSSGCWCRNVWTHLVPVKHGERQVWGEFGIPTRNLENKVRPSARL